MGRVVAHSVEMKASSVLTLELRKSYDSARHVSVSVSGRGFPSGVLIAKRSVSKPA